MTDNVGNNHRKDKQTHKAADYAAESETASSLESWSYQTVLKILGQNVGKFLTINLNGLRVNWNLPIGFGKNGSWLGSPLPTPTGHFSALKEVRIILENVSYIFLGTSSTETLTLEGFLNFGSFKFWFGLVSTKKMSCFLPFFMWYFLALASFLVASSIKSQKSIVAELKKSLEVVKSLSQI